MNSCPRVLFRHGRILRQTHRNSFRAMSNSANQPQAIQPQPGDEPDDVLFNSLYGMRSIELNRPKKLNSLNGSMARKILPRLREFEKSAMANTIVISGAGEKAFCAGGDVAELAKNNATKEGQLKSTDYFALEYQLDHLIATYSKPYIAVMDGITMGGGVGLSVHAPFRIATEKTVFAMPETTIGFFPDVGGSFFLSRLDGEIGTYLALTSERLIGVQAFYAGIATHYLDSSNLQPLSTRLSELQFQDHADLDERLQIINKTIGEFVSDLPSQDNPKSPYGNISGSLRAAIDRTFRFHTIEEILKALKSEVDNVSSPSYDEAIAKWAQATLDTIAQRSPTSLKVTLRQLRLGSRWTIGETFVREHELAARFMQHPDFTEGVSARLIEKPARAPKWQPAKLEQVGDDDVATFFTMPEGIKNMELLEPSQDTLPDYRDYPHAKYALPREKEIREVVRNNGEEGAKAIEQAMLKKWNNKHGVLEKVREVVSRRATKQSNGAIVWNDKSSTKL